jgi:hypothetical protein
MPKRKRGEDDVPVEKVFSRFRIDLYRALKKVRGFERQRQSKRLRDAKATPDKKARIEKEIVVLKVGHWPNCSLHFASWAFVD